VQVVDDYTVRFLTHDPSPIMLERMQNFQMVSEKVAKDKGDAFMAENPIGTGPYKFVHWLKGREILMERNDNYWGPKPAFKYAKIRIIPDKATQVADLLAGGVDLVRALPPDQIEVLKASGAAYVTTAPVLRVKEGKGGPMFQWSWGYYSVFDADGILYDIFHSGRYSLVDNLCTMFAVGGQAMPIFWLGIMLIIIFSVKLRWLPASGAGSWAHLVLPATTLGVFLAPLTMRLVRSGMLEVLSQDYVRTARAKGASERQVLLKHTLRNAAIPVITVIGLQFGQLLGGHCYRDGVCLARRGDLYRHGHSQL
jgi:hypothetical protein